MGKLVSLLEFAEKRKDKLTAKQRKHLDNMYLYHMEVQLGAKVLKKAE